MGVAAQPLGLVTHNVIAAIVRLAGLGGKVPVFPGLKQLHARRVQIGAPVRKDAQRAVVLLIERKSFPGSLRRHGAVEEPDRLVGLPPGRIGIAAVHGTQRVCAHIPDSGTVGGDGVPDAGQLRHQRRQAGKGPPGAGQHDDPAPDGIGDGLPGAGGDLALGIEQGAVQIKGDKTDGGRR